MDFVERIVDIGLDRDLTPAGLSSRISERQVLRTHILQSLSVAPARSMADRLAHTVGGIIAPVPHIPEVIGFNTVGSLYKMKSTLLPMTWRFTREPAVYGE